MLQDDHHAATASGSAAPRILIVEPKRSYLGVMARRLGEAGYRIASADCGANAIAELHRTPIDLIIAELYMPRMSGAELARAIRSEIAWADLPIMLITNRSRPDGPVAAYAAGADDVILKPFHFEVLFARIQRRLSLAGTVRRLCDDNAALDARVVARAIELGELKERLRASETERQRLERLVGRAA